MKSISLASSAFLISGVAARTFTVCFLHLVLYVAYWKWTLIVGLQCVLIHNLVCYPAAYPWMSDTYFIIHPGLRYAFFSTECFIAFHKSMIAVHWFERQYRQAWFPYWVRFFNWSYGCNAKLSLLAGRRKPIPMSPFLSPITGRPVVFG